MSDEEREHIPYRPSPYFPRRRIPGDRSTGRQTSPRRQTSPSRPSATRPVTSPRASTSRTVNSPEDNLRFFFRDSLKALEGSLPRYYDDEFKRINNILIAEGLKTRALGINKRNQRKYVKPDDSDEDRSDTDEDFEAHYEIKLDDVTALSKEQVKKIILGIWKLSYSSYPVLAQINSLAHKYHLGAYMVPFDKSVEWVTFN